MKMCRSCLKISVIITGVIIVIIIFIVGLDDDDCVDGVYLSGGRDTFLDAPQSEREEVLFGTTQRFCEGLCSQADGCLAVNFGTNQGRWVHAVSLDRVGGDCDVESAGDDDGSCRRGDGSTTNTLLVIISVVSWCIVPPRQLT